MHGRPEKVMPPDQESTGSSERQSKHGRNRRIVLYTVPCKNCRKVYVGETGRSFGVQMKEHQKEADYKKDKNVPDIPRNSQSEQNKPAITDHINTENHVINCDEATIIGRESDSTTWWIRQVVKI